MWLRMRRRRTRECRCSPLPQKFEARSGGRRGWSQLVGEGRREQAQDRGKGHPKPFHFRRCLLQPCWGRSIVDVENEIVRTSAIFCAKSENTDGDTCQPFVLVNLPSAHGERPPAAQHLRNSACKLCERFSAQSTPTPALHEPSFPLFTATGCFLTSLQNFLPPTPQDYCT